MPWTCWFCGGLRMNLCDEPYASVLLFQLGYMALGEASLKVFLHREADWTDYMVFCCNKNSFYSQRELLVLLGRQHMHWSFPASLWLILAGAQTAESLLLLPLLFSCLSPLIIKWGLPACVNKSHYFPWTWRSSGAVPGRGTQIA